MNVCLICEASLSHHTLYMGNLVPAYTMYHVFPCWKKRRKIAGKKSASPHQFWNQPMTRNQRLFLFGLRWPVTRISLYKKTTFLALLVESQPFGGISVGLRELTLGLADRMTATVVDEEERVTLKSYHLYYVNSIKRRFSHAHKKNIYKSYMKSWISPCTWIILSPQLDNSFFLQFSPNFCNDCCYFIYL